MVQVIATPTGYLSGIAVGGVAVDPSPGGNIPTPVMEHDARYGVSTSGSTVTGWVDQIDSQSPAVTGTPERVSSPSGAYGISFEDGDFMTLTGTGDMPTGNDPGTYMVLAKIVPQGSNTSGWGLYSAGTGVLNQSRGIVVDGENHTADGDFFQNDIRGFSVDDGLPFVATLVVQGDGTSRLYHGQWFNGIVEDLTLATGATQVNFARSYNSVTRPCTIYYAAAWDVALTPSQIVEKVAGLRAAFLDETAPVVSSPAMTALTSQTAKVSCTVSKPRCKTYCVVTTSSVKPSAVQIKAGEDHNGQPGESWISGPFVTEIDQFLIKLFTPTQTYYAHFYSEDEFGLPSEIVTSPACVMPAEDPEPTSVTPTSVTFSEATTPGSIVADFDTDVPAAFSQGTPSLSFLSVHPETGELTLLNSVSAQTANLILNAGGAQFTVPITVQSTGQVTADYTVANYTALQTLLKGWGGTVPLGRDVTVLVQNGENRDLDLSFLPFDHTVTVRSGGPYTMSTNANGEPTVSCGADLQGRIDFRESRRIRFFRVKITTGGGYDRSYFQGASDITFDHCALFGAAFAYNIPGTTPGGYDWILQIDMADRVHLVDCLIAYSSNSHIGVYASTGTTLRQNLFCFNRHDNFKFDAPTVDLLLDRNWFSRHVARRWLGTEYTHVDFCQDPNSPVTTTNFRGIGNVMWAGDPTVGGVGASQQGFFLKNSNLVGGYVEQNIIATVGRNVLRNENATNGFYARYNDLLRNEVGGSGASQTGDNPGITGITSTYHVIATHNLGGWATAGSEVVDLNAQPPDDFSDYNGSGLYTDHPKGYSRDFNWARPPNASARTHWDNANPVGAFARKKEIFVDGRHPGNEGWPVAAQWTHDFNSAGNIASGFTGSLTANGDNV